MLIEFSVANYRSLQSRQTLSLAKGKGDELAKTNTFKTRAFNDFELLRSAVVFGPNAGGKTNLWNALQVMREVVVESASDRHQGDPLPIVPFRLSKKTQEAPSEFEVTFIAGRVRYQYGFTVTPDRIQEEWLIAYPKGRPQRWFYRLWNKTKRRYDWELGNNLTGEKQLWQKSTRDNALFLSTAVQLNSKQLRAVYDWFKTTLRITNLHGWGTSFSASLCQGEEKSRVLDFLRAADLGIDDINVEKGPFEASSLPDDMPQVLRDQIAKEMKGQEVLDIQTVHRTAEGLEVTFDFEDESDGTQRLFAFAGPWIDSLANGYVLVIDELHANLHPRLVRFLVELFHNKETNPKNAQLIFTTHETAILSQNLFRRDQIWFCQKNSDQKSELYPLTDFSPRKGRDNLELAYLSGRYGALPFVRPLRARSVAGG